MRFERWAIALVAVILAAAGSACQGRPAGPSETARPTSTPPPPASPTATATQAVLKIETPTPTPAPASASVCPEDPRVWQLVPLQGGLRDPKTGKPIQLPKPPQRIDPPCVYEGLARDLARSLVPNPDFPAPAVRGKTLSVPWFWAPGMEAPTIRVIVDQGVDFEADYDAGGRRIEDLFLPYTAVATGDPDYPVLVYVYRDLPGVAWALGRGAGGEESLLWARVRLEGGEAARFVFPVVYEAKTRRWVWVLVCDPASSPEYPRRSGRVGGGRGGPLRAAPVAAGGAAGPLRLKGHLPGVGQPGGGEAHRDAHRPPGRGGGEEVRDARGMAADRGDGAGDPGAASGGGGAAPRPRLGPGAAPGKRLSGGGPNFPFRLQHRAHGRAGGFGAGGAAVRGDPVSASLWRSGGIRVSKVPGT
jgi:hypothetical protein